MKTILKLLKKNKKIKEIYGTYHILYARLYFYKYVKKIDELSNNIDHTKYTQFYIKKEKEIIQKINKNKSTYVSKNVDNVDLVRKKGKEFIKFLEKYGLNQDCTVLDYGCGGLRFGKSLIEYLNPKKYTGVDISDIFFEGCYNFLGDDIIFKKKPVLYVIGGDDYNKNIENKNFDFIYSTLVVMHVHPNELEKYFKSVIRHMHKKSIFFFDFQPALFTIKKNSLTWGHSYNLIFGLIEKLGAIPEIIYGSMIKVVIK